MATGVDSTPKLASMDYRIIRPLGAGAGSTILLIRDEKSGQHYALKVVKRLGPADDIYLNQAQHEFEVARRLDQENLLKIYDCRTRRRWFRVSGIELLMEYVHGRPIDECKCNSVQQIVLVFNKVTSALIHMHRRGVYHGDLKPSNILLSRTGDVKVIDFGTAWLQGHNKGRVQGTPQYMAPEQATEKVVNERTDLYNLGATMYRLLTGQYANLGMPQVSTEALGGVGGGGPTPPIQINPDVPGPLNDVVMACLQQSPARRPANVAEVKERLKIVRKQLGLHRGDIKGSEENCD